MKRLLGILLLVCILLLSIMPAGAEENPASGCWYADLNGLSITLTLSADGTYTFTDVVLPENDQTGAWELRDGFIYLDGNEYVPLSFNGSTLTQVDLGLLFTREKPRGYIPADIMSDAAVDMFAGYWKAAYADVNGTPVPVALLDDETDLYVDGHSAILGGPMLGDTQVKLTFENSALFCDNEGVKAELLLQADGLLRLTVTGSETMPQTWYLMRVYSPAQDGETDQPEK